MCLGYSEQNEVVGVSQRGYLKKSMETLKGFKNEYDTLYQKVHSSCLVEK